MTPKEIVILLLLAQEALLIAGLLAARGMLPKLAMTTALLLIALVLVSNLFVSEEGGES